MGKCKCGKEISDVVALFQGICDECLDFENSKTCTNCRYKMDGVVENDVYCGLLEDVVNINIECSLYESEKNH